VLVEETQSSFKKNKEQTLLLDVEFDKNPIWSKEKMRELASQLGLKESQIYKWHWDRSQTVQKRYQKNLRKISKNQESNSNTTTGSSENETPFMLNEFLARSGAFKEEDILTELILQESLINNIVPSPQFAAAAVSQDLEMSDKSADDYNSIIQLAA
jgi:Homeodomain